MSEKNAKWIVLGIVGLCVLLFTIFGFLVPQECGIDQEYLYCRLHPMSFFDIIGLILFYGAAVVLSGVKVFDVKNATKVQYFVAGGGIAGLLLIWL